MPDSAGADAMSEPPASNSTIELRGGGKFRPAYLLGALVAGVTGLALTSTWVRRDVTVGEGTVATVYGVLALVSWIVMVGLIALAFAGFLKRD